MKHRLTSIFSAAWVASSLLLSGTVSAALTEPDCASLERWSSALSQGNSFTPREGIAVNALFEDAQVLPLFGAPLVNWQQSDVSSLQAWLADCRKQAMAAGRRDAGNALYAALKTLKQTSRSMRSLWNAQRVADRQVENLLALKPSPALPEILAIADSALAGEALDGRVSALDRQWQGYGKQAAQLADSRGLLSDEDIAQWREKLAARRAEVAGAIAEGDAAHAELLAEIAAVPMTQAGLSQLNRIASRADPGAMSRADQDSYNAAFQSKRQQIQRTLAAEQAQVAQDMATLPAPVSEAVAAVLQGDTPGEASIRGLQPGTSYNEIQAAAKRIWGYAEAISLGEEDKQLTTIRREFDRLLREERRDGGLLNLRTRKGVVGELSYVEHFPGPLDIAPLASDLQARFGEPDEQETHPDGSQSMLWHDGDKRLRVRAGNRVTPAREFMKVRSSVELSLWTEDFADYLRAAAERCRDLRNKPSGDLSVNDKQAILMKCLTP